VVSESGPTQPAGITVEEMRQRLAELDGTEHDITDSQGKVVGRAFIRDGLIVTIGGGGRAVRPAR
jgi:hypothetical protein